MQDRKTGHFVGKNQFSLQIISPLYSEELKKRVVKRIDSGIDSAFKRS